MDGGAWWAAVHGVDKSRTQLSDFTFTSHFHALEEEMATHSSVLARKCCRKTSVFLLRETGMSGHFVGRIKGDKYRFELQFLKWDFS